MENNFVQELKKDNKNKYSIEELKEIINYYLNNYDNSQIDVMFVKKEKKKNKKMNEKDRVNKIVTYKTYMLECSKESIKPAIMGTLQNIYRILLERKLDKYDLELSLDDTIQIISENKVIHSKEILSNITIQYDDTNTLNDKIEFDKLDFLVMQISLINGKIPKIVFLKKYLKPSSKYKNAIKGTFNGKEFKPMNQKILVIGDNVDAFLIDGYYYVVNRNNFNSMLEFKDVYYKIIEQNTENIKSSNIIDNSEQFIIDCQNDGRYLQRFTKAILAKGFENAKEYHSNLPQLIKKHKLNLVLNDNGEIVYNKDNINEILNLLLEHYVTSDLTNRSMIAKAIEKYNE